ncbi:dUTP diphosphatase [Porticoccaceae bacterium]|jgi:dimeric dUTPase (all-alpha-NTP-PPase superfamily)|nr:dUTP diphosphatase [Porticoccaceae bacterium]MDA9015048.1 dUTP diphosphatase [Porticoccaceae bacterium]
MKQQISTMLELQDSMNSKVRDDWREQNFEWYRAIWIECAELLDHHGWKWWKKQQPDVNQIALELVDIWHFGLSLLLLKDQSHQAISESVVKAFNDVEASGDFAINLEEFTKNTLVTKDFDINGFVGLVKGINMQFDQLYIAYVGKNVLNFFRQDHGYQDGSYHKQWGGKEDNEHLVEIVEKLDTNLPTFKDDLYSEMKTVYQQLCA